MMLKRCIEDDPGYAGIEKWMRSLGGKRETVLAAQWEAKFPKLCVWQRGHFLMERCDELLWPEAVCGVAIGLWQVAHDVCVENGVTLDSWRPRIRMAFPRPCSSREAERN